MIEETGHGRSGGKGRPIQYHAFGTVRRFRRTRQMSALQHAEVAGQLAIIRLMRGHAQMRPKSGSDHKIKRSTLCRCARKKNAAFRQY